MAVIVDHRGVADLLDAQIGTLGAEGADAALDVIDAVGMGPDRHQLRALRHRRLGRGAEPGQAAQRKRLLQQMPTIHMPTPSRAGKP